MDILEGVAAFAVLMIIFSTIASAIVEIILRLLATKQALLIRAVERLVHDELEERGTELLDAGGKVVVAKGSARKVAEKLTRNPLLVPADKSEEAADKSEKAVRFFRLGRYGHQKITTYSLLQRLAKSNIGDAIALLGEDKIRPLLVNFARTYERYVAVASEQFRIRAHMWTALVAIIFAFSMNIDAGRIFSHLVADKDARDVLFQQAEQAMENNTRVLDALNNRPEDQAAEPLEGLSEDVAAIRKSLEDVKTDAGLPIGVGYFPYCRSEEGKQTGEDKEEEKTASKEEGFWNLPACVGEKDRDWFTWPLFTLLAGLLIGLGGPFWYKVYSSLSQVAGITRMLKSGEVISDQSTEQPASKVALGEKDIVETFVTARVGRDVVK